MRGKDNKPHFHVTAGLIRLEGKLLITKRPRGSHMEGLWEFPGGKQEKGETLKECLEREIEEELGIKVRAEKLLSTIDYEYENRFISLHIFQCLYLAGQPEPLENQEIIFVHPEDLAQYRFPPPDQKVIQTLSLHSFKTPLPLDPKT